MRRTDKANVSSDKGLDAWKHHLCFFFLQWNFDPYQLVGYQILVLHFPTKMATQFIKKLTFHSTHSIALTHHKYLWWPKIEQPPQNKVNDYITNLFNEALFARSSFNHAIKNTSDDQHK